MLTLDEIKTRHAAELAQAEKIEQIAAQLPAKPDSLTYAYGGHYWATFKTANPSGVAAIVRQFAPLIVPTVEIKDGCLYQLPLELLPQRLRARAEAEGKDRVFDLTTHQGKGFGVTVQFSFFARTASGVFVRVICDLPDNWKAGARMTHPTYLSNGEPRGDGRSEPNAALRGLFHDFIKWSQNTPGEDARFSYTLIDDLPECRETLELLENTELSKWWAA